MMDYDALREALWDECLAAGFGGGIGPALLDALDADVIDHSLSDPTKEIKPHEQARYAKLCEELEWKG